MGNPQSYDYKKTYDINGVKTIHYEKIRKNIFGLTITYIREGDRGNQKIVITKSGNDYRVIDVYEGQTAKYDKIFTKSSLIELLTTSHLQKELKFVVDYIQTYEK